MWSPEKDAAAKAKIEEAFTTAMNSLIESNVPYAVQRAVIQQWVTATLEERWNGWDRGFSDGFEAGRNFAKKYDTLELKTI